MENALISLDAHAHFDPASAAEDLRQAGAVLASTLSLGEAEQVFRRSQPNIVFGLGCHPRLRKALDDFDLDRFDRLLQQTPLVGEIGLDAGARPPIGLQLQVFRSILDALQGVPRLVSIHSYQATRMVLDELEKKPLRKPLLHWWTGNVPETCRAVELGCSFSIHSAVARHSKFRLHVPLDRILVESDHGWGDPPAAIPYRIRWVEYLTAQQYRMPVDDLRALVWDNFSKLVDELDIAGMFPPAFTRQEVSRPAG